MSSIIKPMESEFDFKEPLSPTTPRTQSRVGSTHSLSRVSTIRGLTPPPQVKSAYGLMGSVGIVVTLIIFLADLATDVYLIFASWTQAENEPNYYLQRRKQNMFKITLLIVLVPIFIINVFSFAWYMQNKHMLRDHRLFHVKNKFQKSICVLLHLLFIGQISRYFDTLHYGKKIKKYHQARPRAISRASIQQGSRASSHLGSKGSIHLGSRGSLHHINTDMQEIDTRSLAVLTRDTAILELMYNFLKNVPQLIFQIFLIYRSSYSYVEKSDALTVLSQILKILIGLFYTSWSLVTYQDELRHASPGKIHLSCGATIVCLIWRACLAGSRIIAIASIAALKIDGEGGLVKVYSDNAPSGAVLGFPAITSFVLIGHWILMILWIHSQKTTFCHTEHGGSRSCLEFFYNVCMGWVEIFSYLNLKTSPSRRRMIFFYSLIFMENTAFMVIWYLQLITKDVWLRVIVIFSVEALFVIGLSCAIGYFAFLHPSHEKYERSSDDTRSVTQTELTWR